MQRLAFLLSVVKYLQKYYSISTAIIITVLLNILVTLPLYTVGEQPTDSVETVKTELVQTQNELAEAKQFLESYRAELKKTKAENEQLRKDLQSAMTALNEYKVALAEAKANESEKVTTTPNPQKWPW
ncbi:hypothetical protein [Vibrio phage vB_pir03]|nr:hypothetical protein [Vibrio phage vB_pir03]